MKKELLVGCGASRKKRIHLPNEETWSNLTTLDMNPDHKPDVIWNLENFPLPFEDNSFDEIHAYEVLEHTGVQGDWQFFFAQFLEFYRILKPDGLLCGTSPGPNSPWLWGDPGHTRTISSECFIFLSQLQYTKQIGKTTMTDYRFFYKGDFDPLFEEIAVDGSFVYILQAIKPSRISYEARSD